MGTVVISLDAELAWGFHDLEELPTMRIKQAREGWLELLDLFEEFEVPATWAIVGHLFLDECDGAHQNLTSTNNWFSRDPGGTATDTSNWFGPDLIKSIQDATVDHDIGSHTFSHVVLGDETTTKEIARAEIRESKRIANEMDIDLQSFIFPRNRVAYREILAQNDFLTYRGNQPSNWYNDTVFYPVGKFLSTISCCSPPLINPSIDKHELVNIPASMYLFTFDRPLGPFTKATLGDVIVCRAKRGIDKAISKDGILHLWLHPNNITDSQDIDRMRQIIEYIDTCREENDLLVRTMDQIARQVKKQGRV